MLWRGCSSPRPILGKRGATSLEFALVGSLLLTLILGASEAGRYMITLQSLRSAADEAVRLVVLRGGANINAGISPCAGLSGGLSGVAERVAFLEAASVAANLTACNTSSNGITTVSILVRYPFVFKIQYFGRNNQIIEESALALFN